MKSQASKSNRRSNSKTPSNTCSERQVESAGSKNIKSSATKRKVSLQIDKESSVGKHKPSQLSDAKDPQSPLNPRSIDKETPKCSVTSRVHVIEEE